VEQHQELAKVLEESEAWHQVARLHMQLQFAQMQLAQKDAPWSSDQSDSGFAALQIVDSKSVHLPE